MIRPHDIGMNSGIRDTRCKLTRVEEIINSPTRVICTGIPEWRPPGIRSFETRISLAKNIYQSHFEEFFETMAFLECESVFPFILFPVFQIDGLVSDIQISAKYNRFMSLEFMKEISHSTIPLLTICET